MTTETTDLTSILDKIARLKTLVERPGTPEEAAAAVAAIQRLTTRYNLSEVQVDAATRNDQQGFDNVRFDIGAGMQWRKNLLTAIARYSFCEAIFDHKGRGANIVGEKHNIEIVTGLYEYLVDTVMRLANEGWEALDPFEKSMTTAQRWKHSFRVGAGAVLADRLREQHRAQIQEQQQENDQTNALVVLKSEELQKAVSEYYPRLRSFSFRSSLSDNNGYGAGREAGRSVNLAKQITA